MKRLISLVTALCCVLFMGKGVCAEPSVSAASAILINADTGAVIYEKNAHEKRAIASTTKILTALVTILSGELDKSFTVDSCAIRVEGTSMGLCEGDIVTRRALLYGMLLPSGNDAANAAAVSVSGSLEAFAEKMNLFAKAVGMNESNFVTPSGLDADGHYSTAYDMAILTRYALENEIFAEICGLSEARVSFGNPPYERTLYNSNKMLWQYDGATGVKTGFTDNARRCLVSSAERDGERLICVTLNAPDDWDDHSRLLDYGFELLEGYEADLSGLYIDTVGAQAERARVVSAEKLVTGLTESERSAVSLEIKLIPFVYGGARAGEKVGTAQLVYNGEPLSQVDLLLAEDVVQQQQRLGFWDGLCRFLSQFFN